ncbi:MAG: multidrug efflux RND transporter permease subunit [Alphaproteobacteria bacterium]|jgi:hydrophobe/amphiphile efflux-1 (HAE1) family protein|nr:multidrug efflux RND transporter permease subunit [Alphaproteobacteria bacterium]MDP7221936.1 multidrug efflux RND transporter permease subunit [Alphaproteobacteria bacterium]
MKFSDFFIVRPIFATVVSSIIVIIGMLAYFNLPVEQYPQIAPPTIQVSASYPGANAQTVADTVATPLEQEISGIEGMLYMLSQSTADGRMSLTITFELGTDLDEAQVLVQNRVSIAEPRLPEQVRRLGVTTQKNSPDLMLVVNMFSPDKTYDQTYIGNYAVLKVRDQLKRIDGIGDVMMFGAAEYAMRVWLNPDLVQSYGMTAGEVVQALRAQNVQVAGGVLNQSPQPDPLGFEFNIQTQGRLIDPAQFENIIVKSGEDGRIVRLRDVGRVELGAQDYSTRGYMGESSAIALPVFQRPGSNALETADAVKETMEALKAEFPAGLDYRIVYNPTDYIDQSIAEVIKTMLIAVLLVVFVVILFLQTWRAAIIPVMAIPVSLIGTFAVMFGLDFSLNSLTLFGLVLAIGVVVDDAIVVVENVERNLARGLKPVDAAKETMREVGSALIATSLVLVAVFLPTAFLGGITGQFYKQFGVTIAVATMISTIVSLTLSPAMAALFMHKNENDEDHIPRHKFAHPLRFFFCEFNKGMSYLSDKYGNLTKKLVLFGGLVLIVYAALIGLTGYQFNKVPRGFIPPQDQGYFIISIQLPSAASLERTDKVVQETTQKILALDGVANAVGFTGFSGATFTNASNAGVIFPVLDSFEKRHAAGLSYDSILGSMRGVAGSIKDAFVVVIPPPPVRGIGTAGGFRMMVQDREGRGLDVLEQAAWTLAGAANQSGVVTSVFTMFENSTPQLYLDINREQAERLGVPVQRIFEALEIYIGSVFVNDFNYLGRTFRVTAQADAPYRLTADDALRLRVRNDSGEMIPIGAVATVADTAGSSRVPRYNLYPAASLMGDTLPGRSTGEGLMTMEHLADQVLPDGIGYEWTEIAYQQKQTGNTAAVAFALAVLFVFLVLSAQYESWVLPLAIVLIVPMCLLSAITGISLAGMDNNILTQIGLVTLVGLACKNAILIVEFARDLEEAGRNRWDAAVEAATLRFRPILMTSMSFILGVLPLIFATGAGSEMRQALGVTVFSGMLGVTVFGLLFTPVFYVLCRKLDFLGNEDDKKQAALWRGENI